ncbi:hypothetical protein PG996_011754 [Apiospora saccharicola]|uniref:PIG-P domain-containing protein n=1 Tax=Apiospora saccharicola TaxID=335842 RepID=A0ABR1UGI7_9PEZI
MSEANAAVDDTRGPDYGRHNKFTNEATQTTPLVPAGPRRTTTGSSRIATARGYQSVVDETPPADPNPFSDDGGDLGPIDDSNDDDDDDSSSSSNHMSFLFVHWPEIMAYCIFVLISLMCPFLAAYDWIYNGNGGGWLYWVGVFVLSIPALSFPVLLWLYTKEGVLGAPRLGPYQLLSSRDEVGDQLDRRDGRLAYSSIVEVAE